jgi:transcriptional regulator with XRE-family HTH domain
MSVDRRYFESLLRDRDMSLRALAKQMGMSHSQLSLTFGGDRRLQIDEAVQISAIFGEPLSKVIEAAGVSLLTSSPSRVFVVGAMGGDGIVSMSPSDSLNRTTAPELLPKDGIGVQARTAGTALDWLDGTVFFMAEPVGISASSIGRFSFVKLSDGRHAMAAVRRGYQDGTFNLYGTHKHDSVRLDFATPVLFSRH